MFSLCNLNRRCPIANYSKEFLIEYGNQLSKRRRMMYKNNKFWLILGILTVLVLVLAGCAKEETPAATEAPPPVVTEAPVVQEAPTPGGTDYSKVVPELVEAMDGKDSGTVVTMAGPFTDNDAVVFDASIKDFEDKTGIDTQYSGSKEFEA